MAGLNRYAGMPSKGEKTARNLRNEVDAITRGVPMRWVSVHELGLRHPDLTEDVVDQAVDVAIAKGTPPHSVCLIDAGRRAASTAGKLPPNPTCRRAVDDSLTPCSSYIFALDVLLMFSCESIPVQPVDGPDETHPERHRAQHFSHRPGVRALHPPHPDRRRVGRRDARSRSATTSAAAAWCRW